MLRAIGLDRHQNVYIANVLKCRPPANRNPEPHEVAQCAPYLQRQIELLQPKVILAMGRFAIQSLLQTTEPIGKLRGRTHQYHGVPVIATYHPAYLLRNLPDGNGQTSFQRSGNEFPAVGCFLCCHDLGFRWLNFFLMGRKGNWGKCRSGRY